MPPPLDPDTQDTTPTIPLTEIQRVRLGQVAKDLEAARLQAYIEANLGMKALEVVKAIIPILAGLAGV
jgi:hypothetical protein